MIVKLEGLLFGSGAAKLGWLAPVESRIWEGWGWLRVHRSLGSGVILVRI